LYSQSVRRVWGGLISIVGGLSPPSPPLGLAPGAKDLSEIPSGSTHTGAAGELSEDRRRSICNWLCLVNSAPTRYRRKLSIKVE